MVIGLVKEKTMYTCIIVGDLETINISHRKQLNN